MSQLVRVPVPQTCARFDLGASVVEILGAGATGRLREVVPHVRGVERGSCHGAEHQVHAKRRRRPFAGEGEPVCRLTLPVGDEVLDRDGRKMNGAARRPAS